MSTEPVELAPDEPVPEKCRNAKEFALKSLEESAVPLRPSEMADGYDCSNGHMRNVLRELMKEEMVDRVDHGEYVLSDGETADEDASGASEDEDSEFAEDVQSAEEETTASESADSADTGPFEDGDAGSEATGSQGRLSRDAEQRELQTSHLFDGDVGQEESGDDAGDVDGDQEDVDDDLPGDRDELEDVDEDDDREESGEQVVGMVGADVEELETRMTDLESAVEDLHEQLEEAHERGGEPDGASGGIPITVVLGIIVVVGGAWWVLRGRSGGTSRSQQSPEQNEPEQNGTTLVEQGEM